MNLLSSLNTQSNDTIKLDHMVENTLSESYLDECLTFIIECKKEYNDASKYLLKSIMEATDTYAINESFSEYFSKAIKIIEKILKFVKTLFDKFVTKLASFVKSDSYLKKHRLDFNKFTDEDSFDIDGFNFTISESVPRINALTAFTSEFVDLSLKPDLDKDSLIEQLNAATREIIELRSNGYYDDIRQDIIYWDQPIVDSEYSNKLFASYRDGESLSDTIVIKKQNVNQSLKDFENYKETVAFVKSTQSSIDRQYTEIKKMLSQMVSSNFDKRGDRIALNIPGSTASSVEFNRGVLSTLDTFVKAKTEQVDIISKLHLTAFAAKLDAVNALYIQDKTILYKALSKVQKFNKEDAVIGNIEHATGFYEGVDIWIEEQIMNKGVE